jgi:iron-sulfur cluster repair protein YtfE (RIC family)
MATQIRSTRPSRTGTSSTRHREAQDAIAVLKADHRAVDELFAKFEKTGKHAYKTKRSLVDRMITELSVHAAIEEAILYPAARAEVPDTESEVLESLEEHHVVKWLLTELDGIDPETERFDAKVAVLTENVRHHVSEEEDTLFPALRTHLTRSRLAELGKELHNAKSHVPTHPHPRSPDTPPLNVLPDAVAHVLDKAKDVVRGGRS